MGDLFLSVQRPEALLFLCCFFVEMIIAFENGYYNLSAGTL